MKMLHEPFSKTTQPVLAEEQTFLLQACESPRLDRHLEVATTLTALALFLQKTWQGMPLTLLPMWWSQQPLWKLSRPPVERLEPRLQPFRSGL